MARQTNSTTATITALLNLAGKSGWAAVTPTKLAIAAKITEQAAATFLTTPTQTMRAIADFVTAAAAQNYRHDKRGSTREALFEILMLRFDVLQRHRAGFLALQQAARRDPRLTAALAQAIYPQCDAILRLAQITAEPPINLLQQAGLGAIYGAALCVWKRDDSPDLAKTMAALDRQLRRTEQLMRFMNRRPA